jgi:DNA polymerase-3 subunit delta
MRIDTEQLPQHLKRGLSPLYVVFGEELLLALEAADRIRAAAAAAGHEERKIFIADPAFDWQSLLAAANNLSLFAPKRLLDLRVPSGKPGKEGGEALTRLARDPPPDTITLITLPAIDRQSQGSKWFEALENGASVVYAAAVIRERLPKWIEQRLGAQGQHASAETLAFIADRVEGNLMAAHQEVQKLALLFPAGELPFDGVKQAVLDVARFDVFDIGTALLKAERRNFVRMLDGLRAEGAPPPLVLWAIAEQARTLARLKHLQAHGVALGQAMRELRLWGPRQQLTQQALARIDRPRLLRILAEAAEADRMIKGLEKGDVWDTFLRLGLSFFPQADTPAIGGRIVR